MEIILSTDLKRMVMQKVGKQQPLPLVQIVSISTNGVNQKGSTIMVASSMNEQKIDIHKIKIA